MRAAARRLICFALLTAILLSSVAAAAQVFVYPRRAGKTNARYFDFEWRWINVLTSPDAELETLDTGPRGSADSVSSVAAAPGDPMNPTYPPLYPAGDHLYGVGNLGTAASESQPASSDDTNSEGGAENQQEREREATGGQAEKSLAERAGGFRLYFYESERESTQRAVATIEDQYRQLARQFDFAPPKTFPFILYNSYTEFLQTNLFPIQEGTLGVTSPRSLKLTLPYFGDHRQFARVSIHELVHQFTVQKIQVVAGQNEAIRSPLESIPLWFIEGLAEYYTHGGMDPETSMLIRDLTVNQALRRGYVLGSFFDAGPRSFLWIYKMGQARCVFLEETYGSGVLQRILNKSYLLAQGDWKEERVDSFRQLLARVTGDEPKKIAAKFDDWLKRRAYADYLKSSQGAAELDRLTELERYMRGLDATDDGHVLMYKTISRMTGRNRIFLVDSRDLSSEQAVVSDGRPGLESLHPLAERNFDVGREKLAFVARAKGYDRIFLQPYEHSWSGSTNDKDADDGADKGETGEQTDEQSEETGENAAADKKKKKNNGPGRAKFSLGKRRVFDLKKENILAAEAVSLSPNDDRIAFIGLHDDGLKDIYILDPKDNGDYELSQITDDTAAERGLDWGKRGLVYTTDQTGHGRYNIFQIAPQPGAEPQRLTSQPEDQFDPAILPDGRVVFVAYDRGRANLHIVKSDGTSRKTNVTTGLFNPSPGPDGAIWALHHHAGRRTPTRVDAENLRDYGSRPSAPDVPTGEWEAKSLENDRNYKPLALRNWSLNNGIGILGITGQGIYGQLYATSSDLLRNHRLMLDLVAFGEFERTDGSLTYINQSDRIIWGLSIFQDFQFRVDQTFDSVEPFISFERFYGARGLMRYPLSQFTYFQLSGGLGGVSYFLSDSAEEFLRDQTPLDEPDPLDEQWSELNDSPRFQTEASVSFGFDSIRYHPQTGPLAGGSFLASLTGDWQPAEGVAYGNFRVDGEYYLPIYDRINAFFRAGSGVTAGGRLARQFFLSSFYTLRGVPFGDTDFLLGRNFFFSTLELQVPLNFIVRIPFLDLEGVVGTDFGGVGNGFDEVWDNRVLNLAAGVNFGFGPIVLRLHFAKPFDIGTEVPNNGDIVPNFSIGWRYL